jgi:hypothetical protein
MREKALKAMADPARIRRLEKSRVLSDWPTIAVTAVLGLGGLYVGNSIHRKTRAEIESKVAERRLEAYYELWKKMKDAAPIRREDARPFDEDSRSRLYDQLTHWYFEEGNGMVLGEDTRRIYLRAKENLICDRDDLRPSSLRQCSQQAAAPNENDTDLKGDALDRARLSMRQLSLLRTSMRADLLVYSQPSGQRLSPEDKAFLKDCDVQTWRRPWRRTLGETLRLRGEGATAFEIPSHRQVLSGSDDIPEQQAQSER